MGSSGLSFRKGLSSPPTLQGAGTAVASSPKTIWFPCPMDGWRCPIRALSRTAQISKGEKGRLSAIEAEETGEFALAGLFVADADPIVGDHLGRYSSWRGEEKLGWSPDSPVLIRFRMRAAELFSVEFV